MAHIHRIGQPENDSELRAIKELARQLPEDYCVVHNLELSTGRGMPYEFDVIVVGEFAVYHVEVKGYGGTIRGDRRQWILDNGAVYPSPIPLANKKSKVLATLLRRHSKRLDPVFVDTVILLTDTRAKPKIRDEQASRILTLDHARGYLTNPGSLPIAPTSIDHLHDPVLEVLLGCKPSQKVKTIGLYDVLAKINQTDDRTVFLAEHKYIRMRPKTILKVFHIDLYASKEEQERRIQAIFHDQEALRLLSGHPNIMQTGDMFPWADDQFVLPTEYIENGRPLEVLLDKEEDRKLTWKEKRVIISKTARGLRHAHRGGVIHRDVRPMNVVVSSNGDVKVVNFDLARIKNTPYPMTPPNLKERLDPRYAAPEVWKKPDGADERSDVYSLGILFYELITSRQPYVHVDEVLAAGKVPLDTDLLLSELSTPGSEDFMKNPLDAAGVIERMTSFDPAARHATMDEVIEDLAIVGD